MAVMNGFRKELFNKILGLNGHVVVYKVGSDDFPDYAEVAKRLRGCRRRQARRAADRGAGHRLHARAGARRQGARPERGGPQGAAADRQATSAPARSTASTARKASPSACAWRNSLRVNVGDNVTLVSPRGATTPFGTAPRIKSYKIAALFEMGMAEYDRSMIFMPLAEAQRFFNKGDSVDVLEVIVEDPENVGQYVANMKAAGHPIDALRRLAAAQRELLHRARGRAQHDVHHPVDDRAGGGVQHHFRPDDAGEGQGPRHRHPAHHGRHARAPSCACS